MKDNIQSRRDFFRNVSKGVLPILGAVLLANIPIISNAADKVSMNCNYSCTAWCADNCSGKCKDTCTSACNRTCSTYCNSSCNIKCYKSAY